MAATGQQILDLAEKHVGETYIFGSFAPKNNANWKGPWDCAEFTSWLVYQVAGVLYGCDNDHGDPVHADAYTGYWDRDSKAPGITISVDQAARTPGAAVLRESGHIVISDGRGGTVEAMGHQWGVTRGQLANRRWDKGILVPGITYAQSGKGPSPAPPHVVVYHVTTPLMSGEAVTQLQHALGGRWVRSGLDGRSIWLDDSRGRARVSAEPPSPGRR